MGNFDYLSNYVIPSDILLNLLNIYKHIGRFEAYSRVMKHNNLEIDPNWIINCHWHRDTGFNETIKFIW